MIKAVFFDMDGTIADSEKLVWQVIRDFTQKRNMTITPEEEKMMFGLTWKEFVRKIFESRGLEYKQSVKDNLKERYVRKLKKSVTEVPGVYSLLEETRKHYKVGLATNSRLREVEIIFDKLGFHPYFDMRIARNDVKNVKPHPEIYLKGAGIFGVQPPECVVFEDSIVGVAAAKAAGMNCIAIINTHSADDLKNADMIISSYKEVSIDMIKELANKNKKK